MKITLQIIQIVIASLLVALIMLQQRGTALGSSFGGEGGGFYSTRRGLQKNLYWLTIACGILFLTLSIVNLVI